MIHPLSYTDQRAQAPRDGTRPELGRFRPGALSSAQRQAPAESLCSRPLCTFLCPSSCATHKDTEAQRGRLTLLGPRAGWGGGGVSGQDWESALLITPWATLHRCRALARPPSELGRGPAPWGAALAHRPLPVTLGLLDQQPGCCAEIQEHKRPHSGKGRGRECGRPNPTL